MKVSNAVVELSALLRSRKRQIKLTLLRLNRFLIVLLFAACFVSGRSTAAAAESEPLRVGVTPVFPPMIHREGKNIAGVEGDFARALAKKQIGLFISDSPTVWWLEGMNEETGLVAVPVMLSQENLAWALRKSDPGLLESVNRALDKMVNNGEAVAIIKRWIPHFK